MVQEFYKKLVKSIYENEGTFLKRGSDNYSYKQLRKVLEGFFWQFSQIERQPIVIVAEKSLEMYAAIIAIILTNNIWVPLSPQIGAKRLASILSRVNPKYIISDEITNSKLPGLEGTLANNMVTFNHLLENAKRLDPNTLKDIFVSEETAMIYFTSGSTGEPKGVLVSHQSYIVNVTDMLSIIDYGKNKVFADIHDTSFVISIPVIFPCIVLGGTISIPSNPLEAFFPSDLLERHEVSCLITVPSVVDRIKIRQPENLEKLNFECLIVCGEPCHISTMEFIKKVLKPKKTYNFYGSTEVGPWIFYIEINDLQALGNNSAFIPIGTPINEDEISIAEDGELIVTGPKVTKGYFGEVEKEKFFVKNDKVWFKTGDIIEKNGNWFSCLGRKDSQIKINGYRIDLMEIEGNTQLLEGVEAAVCIVKEDKVSKFLALIIITKKESMSTEKISGFLTERVPNYMVPKKYYFLTEKPVNKNGKLDRSSIKKKFGAIN